MKSRSTGLMWFRRDLRLADNAALHAALSQCQRVHAVFVLDRDILDALPNADRRVDFILGSLQQLDEALRELGGMPGHGLIVAHARAAEAVVSLAIELKVDCVYAGHDYEPQARARDTKVQAALQAHGIDFHTCKDHVIFEEREIVTQTGSAYGVFTPYKNKWLATLRPEDLRNHEVNHLGYRLAERPDKFRRPTLQAADIGFTPSNLSTLNLPIGLRGGQAMFETFFERMDDYHATRDFPARKGPSYLGVHLRFGTVSIRRLVDIAWQRQLAGSAGAEVWLSELVWRDFYFAILANFPQVAERAFKPAYDAIAWEQGDRAEELFRAWCTGQTGYPLVDAAMAQLNQTGYMHNRLRMVSASFLVKHLGIDWRWGEQYFATHLNDFDLAANNGGWQWVASSGCDAQPYFRIFNPVNQSQKFDPDGKFIRRYLPALSQLSNKSIHAPWTAKPLELQAAGLILGEQYPKPIVDHAQARQDTLARYSVVKNTPEA
jgi:deoxyribodipyrimidine photo-lyase